MRAVRAGALMLGAWLAAWAPSCAQAGEVRLLTSGATGGLGDQRPVLEAHERIGPVLEEAGYTVEAVTPSYAVWSQGDVWLWPFDDRVASVVRFLEAGSPTCDDPVEVPGVRTPTEWVQFDPALSQVMVQAMPTERGRDAVVRTCRAGGVSVRVSSPKGTRVDPDWQLEAFDARHGLRISVRGPDGVSRAIRTMSVPRREAARRAAAQRAARAADPHALFVDAGDFVDGASAHVELGLSLHRDYAFDLLQSLEPTALVPGAQELASGAADFVAEARRRQLPYVVTNWRTDDPALSLPAVRRATVVSGGRPIEIAFLGVLDPDTPGVTARLAPHGVTLADPVEAALEAADRLAEQPPDVVALITAAPPSLLAALRQRLRGVDVLLGDRTAATLRVEAVTTATVPVTRADKAAPITLPLDGLGTVSLQVEDRHLRRAVARPITVTGDDPADPAVRAAVTRVRASVWQDHDMPLIPPTTAPLDPVSEEAFALVVCEAMLEGTRADVGLLGQLPYVRPLPGTMTGLDVARRLADAGVVTVTRIDGDRLQDTLAAANGVVPTACGAPLGERLPKVQGRTIEAERTYWVATTDRTLQTTQLASVLDAGNAGLALQLPKRRPYTDATGNPVSLRRMVLDGLDDWRDEGKPIDSAAIVARAHTDKPAQWVMRMRRLSLRVERFQGMDTDRFSAVPETLANSPSSFTLGGELDAALEHHGTDVAWDLRARAAYTTLTVADAPIQETADDWRVSTSLSLPVARFPRNGLSLMPYTELLYDSEFSPLLDDSGTALTRQADLSVTVGLSSWIWRWLRRLRVGAFLNRDLGRLRTKGTEYGGRLEAETRHDFLPASSLRLATLWDLQVFGDTPTDDAADLRFRGWGEVRLSVRLVRWLDLSTYAQALVIAGRVPETAQVGASFTVGAALDMSAAFQLGRGRWARSRGASPSGRTEP